MTAGFWESFCRSGLKAPQSSVLQGGGEMARGKAQRLSNPSPPTILPDASRTEWRRGCRYLGAYGMGEFQQWWGMRVHRLKVNVPYQHKKEHMSSAVPNCCHIEQFKHLIWTETHPERNCKSIGRLRRTLTWVLLRTAASQEEADVPQCVETWVLPQR